MINFIKTLLPISPTASGRFVATLFLSFALALSSNANSTSESVISYETCESGKNDYLENDLKKIHLNIDGEKSQNTQDCGCDDNSKKNDRTYSRIDELLEDLNLIEGKVQENLTPSKALESALPLACIAERIIQDQQSISKFVSCEGVEKPFTSPRSIVSIKTDWVLGKPAKDRPCASIRYINAIHQAFTESMACMGVDPKDSFDIYNHESHFQINVKSFNSSRAPIGATQMNNETIWRAHWLIERNRIESIEELSKKPECAPMKEHLSSQYEPTWVQYREQVKPEGIYTTCERLKIPPAPWLQFIYGEIIRQDYESQARDFLTEYDSLFTLGVIKKSDREKLLWILTRHFYNGGPGGIQRALIPHFDDLIEKHKTHKRTSFKDFYKGIQGALRANYASSANTEEKRRKKRNEVAAYVDKLISDSEWIEGKINKTCSNVKDI